MSEFIWIVLASGLISFLVTPLLRRLAFSINFVDNPKGRKLHAAPMPMLGGVAIYIGLMLTVMFSEVPSYTELLGVMGGATVVTLVGLWDDRVELPPWAKLLGQVAAAAILILTGIQVNLFSMQALNIAITILWVLGISNAINLLDNMDGLAAGIAMIASGFFFILAVVQGLGLVAALAAALLGACIGFLYYNFNPASLFMGDAGSLLLGFILAVLGIKLEFTGVSLAVTWMIPIIVLGLPIFDTTLVIVSRLRRGQPVWVGGKDHTSHRLISIMGMTPARAVLSLYLIAAALGLLGLMLVDSTLMQARLSLVGLSVLFIAALIWFELRFNPRTDSSTRPPSSDSANE